jgi:hydroxyethylthiazole kinase-like uncharacterized protein yjeF
MDIRLTWPVSEYRQFTLFRNRARRQREKLVTSSSAPTPLYTAAQTRELDRLAIEEWGIPGIRLMARAGRAAFDLLLQQWPEVQPLHIFCGTGNNGGDGFIIASLAAQRSLPVTIYQLGDSDKIAGDAARAREQALAAGVVIQPFAAGLDLARGVIVDAMLGTGLSGDVRGDYSAAIAAINHSGLPALAVDIPSGLCGDSGRVLGSAVVASHTISFIGRKRGLLTAAAPVYTGQQHFTDLAVPADVYLRQAAQAFALSLDAELENLAPRAADAHKGHFGHVLVVGGDLGMAGAALMAAEAAGRCGAGLVSAATHAQHVAAFVSRRPEVMTHGVSSGNDLLPLLPRASVIAIGPGLGLSPWSEQLLFRVLECEQPMVIDADALSLLAAGRIAQSPRRDNWILTPHPGEAARLLDCAVDQVQADRFAAVRALQQQYGGVVLLKGVGTLVCGGDDVFVSTYGNPGMASGGMGDVLSGVLAALLAQGLTPLQAARLGACLHGHAADLASVDGGRGLLASDLLPQLRRLLGS